MKIDLNLDAGESTEDLRSGREESLYRLVSSVNIACGGHAGTEETMREAVRLATQNQLAIGAHPSYPDLEGFGRRELEMPANELRASLMSQIQRLQIVCKDQGVQIKHVKPHGALYNRAAADPVIAHIIVDAVLNVDASLTIVGLASSQFQEVCRARGIRFAREGFVDRRYEENGMLRSRKELDAVIKDPAECARQAIALLRRADTLCIHGDHENALVIASTVRATLAKNGIAIASLR